MQLATGSDGVEASDWPEVCGAFSLDPSKGFDVGALAAGYEGTADGALVKDATMVLKLRQAERGEHTATDTTTTTTAAAPFCMESLFSSISDLACSLTPSVSSRL